MVLSLSINTSAANALPPTSHTSAAGTLFGSSTTTTTAPAPATTGAMSLFGGGAAAQKPAGGGLFGSTTTTNAPAATTTAGGLFGGTPQNQQPPSTGTGLFGNAQSTQQAKPAGLSLFGNTQSNQQQPQQSTGTGLFGASTTAQQNQPQQQSTGTGLFGAPAVTTQNNLTAGSSTGGGLFGQSQAKPATGGMFGQSQAQQQQPQQQAQSQIPAVQINYDNLRPRSRFDDLAQPVQDEIALIDKGIARVIKMKDEIGEFMPQHERDIEQLGRDVKFVESKFRTVQVALNRDIQTVKALQDMTRKNVGDAQLSFKATDNLKLPTHYHQTGLFATPGGGSNASAAAGSRGAANASSTSADAQDLITYFNRICDDVERYKKRLDEYRAEIERDMPGVEKGLYEQIHTLRERHRDGLGNGDGMHDQLGQVLGALREVGTAIVNQAGQIADTRERLSRLQAGILDSGVYAVGMA